MEYDSGRTKVKRTEMEKIFTRKTRLPLNAVKQLNPSYILLSLVAKTYHKPFPLHMSLVGELTTDICYRTEKTTI